MQKKIKKMGENSNMKCLKKSIINLQKDNKNLIKNGKKGLKKFLTLFLCGKKVKTQALWKKSKVLQDLKTLVPKGFEEKTEKRHKKVTKT